MSQPTAEPVDELYRDAVRAARKMSLEERLLAGPRMFDAACDRIRAQLLAAFPQASDADVKRMLREILRIAERRGVL